ncbi:MAG: DUF2156 domain-containing protein [Bacillota bacterium]
MLSNEITIGDKELFQQYITSFPYQVSDINFASIFIWKDLYELRYDVIHGLLCISGKYYDEPFIFPPLTKEVYSIDQLAKTLNALKALSNHPLKIKFAPAHVVDILKASDQFVFDIKEDRNNFDYIYAVKDLSELKGRKLHSKKNHLNYFKKNIPHLYTPLEDTHIEGCLALTRSLKEGDYSDFEKLLLCNEEKAIARAFEYWHELNLFGAVILIEDKIEAFTIGEALSHDTVVVHIEKANPDIKGLYQAINQMFCSDACINFPFVNREEDMGFPNLRKTKESYQPVKLLDKYDVIVK